MDQDNKDSFEKRGVIEKGRTPPEDDSKSASDSEADAEALEEHTSTRLADAARDSIGDKRNSD